MHNKLSHTWGADSPVAVPPWFSHQTGLSHTERMNSLVDGLFTSLGFSAVPVYHPNPGRFLESLWFSVNSASLEMLALTSVMESAAARSAARGRWKVKQVKGKIASFYLTPPFVIGGGLLPKMLPTCKVSSFISIKAQSHQLWLPTQIILICGK